MTGEEFVGWITIVILAGVFAALAGGGAVSALIISALIVAFLFV